MLKPKALTKVLEQANTGGITCTLLLNHEGSLMAFAGKTERKENVTAAIAANIWMSNERGARNAFPDEPLDFIVLDCLEGKVAIKSVANLLLCIYASGNVGLGLLKAKADALSKHLEAPLLQISTT
ncbi:ragulator complex protein LAMTOR2-like [Halichondria panicea]|uniref:ragulator complex protein LAMTOR2-like n=1 Tax=Halichondria panicea TaxID=6063 RepID=UPI00312B696B